MARRSAGGPLLVEHEDLVNPSAQVEDKALFANLKSGRHRAPTGAAHGFDDHRRAHRREESRRFAQLLVTAAVEFVQHHAVEHLVVVAAPRMLGTLRPLLRDALPETVDLAVLGQDLSWHATRHIEDVLVRRGLLEPRVIPADVYLPRAQPPR